MSRPAIEVDNLSKLYSLRASRNSTFREAVENWWLKKNGKAVRVNLRDQKQRDDFGPQAGPLPDTFWALKDVSFSIEPGEVVGVIGSNGAGKSSLLKILARITSPTSGKAVIRGRIASILEVGTGFHPDLSGRENIFLNGAILGMKKSEISKKLDNIIDFAEINKFIDQPVKYYSSGMYVRLAFSVAAHLEGDILFADEVLAVGDAAFQRKTLRKMKDISEAGRTVIFVSHNIEAVSKLTKRCLYLKNGKLQTDGLSDNVIYEYLGTDNPREINYADPVLDGPKITKVELKTSKPGNVQIQGKSLEVDIEIYTPKPLNGAAVAFQIRKKEQSIGFFWIFDKEFPMCRSNGITRLKCRIPKLRIFMGKYNLNVYLAENAGAHYLQKIYGICPFEVVMHDDQNEQPWGEEACQYLDDFSWENA